MDIAAMDDSYDDLMHSQAWRDGACHPRRDPPTASATAMRLTAILAQTE